MITQLELVGPGDRDRITWVRIAGRQNRREADTTSLADQLMIVNAAGTHQWIDLGKPSGSPAGPTPT